MGGGRKHLTAHRQCGGADGRWPIFASGTQCLGGCGSKLRMDGSRHFRSGYGCRFGRCECRAAFLRTLVTVGLRRFNDRSDGRYPLWRSIGKQCLEAFFSELVLRQRILSYCFNY